MIICQYGASILAQCHTSNMVAIFSYCTQGDSQTATFCHAYIQNPCFNEQQTWGDAEAPSARPVDTGLVLGTHASASVKLWL